MLSRLSPAPWPWRELAFVALDVPFGLVTVAMAFPLLLALTAAPARDAVARGAAGLLARHVTLVDPEFASRLRRHTPLPSGRARLVGAVLATGLFFAPGAFLFLLAGCTGVFILAAAPLLVRWDAISLFGWRASEGWHAATLCGLSLPWAGLLTWAAWGFAMVQVSFLRSVTAGDQGEFEVEVLELRSSRDLLIDAFDTERRRIEGMLHDGVQTRMVALAMTLGLAEATASTPEQREALALAHRQADEVLSELRRVIRGVLPRTLTERGLVPALEDLFADMPLRIENDILLDSRLPPRVEQVSYFVVSEALANVMKHSGGSRAHVAGEVRDGTWCLVVEDDGSGGAGMRKGGGLERLRLRAAALDATLRVADRPGGGTILTMVCAVGELTGRESQAARSEPGRGEVEDE